jgi:hypothetical protein
MVIPRGILSDKFVGVTWMHGDVIVFPLCRARDGAGRNIFVIII